MYDKQQAGFEELLMQFTYAYMSTSTWAKPYLVRKCVATLRIISGIASLNLMLVHTLFITQHTHTHTHTRTIAQH